MEAIHIEIKIEKIGNIVERYKKLGYFDSDSLDSAIEKMKNDPDTSFSMNIQIDQKKDSDIDEIQLNTIIQKIWDNI